jgi:hypothetical protein
MSGLYVEYEIALALPPLPLSAGAPAVEPSPPLPGYTDTAPEMTLNVATIVAPAPPSLAEDAPPPPPDTVARTLLHPVSGVQNWAAALGLNVIVPASARGRGAVATRPGAVAGSAPVTARGAPDEAERRRRRKRSVARILAGSVGGAIFKTRPERRGQEWAEHHAQETEM